MKRVKEIYEELKMDNANVLTVAKHILSLIDAKVTKTDDGEIALTIKIKKRKHLIIIDKFADIQYIKSETKNDETEVLDYQVYYFTEGIDYKEILNKLKK